MGVLYSGVEYLMTRALILAGLATAVVCFGAAPAQDSGASPYELQTPATPANQIDKLVFPRVRNLGIEPVLCSDAVFVRRAFLDITGTLPSASEAKQFIHDADTRNKRRLLIDRLLERPEFAEYWAMRWGDVLRIKAEFPVNLWPNAAQAYHRWVKASIAVNKPYDDFAREILTSSGSNFRVGPVNFYRAIQNRTPEGIASAVALTFMGERADGWPKGRLSGMAAFFAQVGYKPTREWKEENVYWDPFGAIAATTNSAASQTNGPPVSPAPGTARFPDGRSVALPANRDPRDVFADWLVRPEDPWFTRAIANRVWSWLMGRGIIHEPDDIRDTNPPSNAGLLVYLEKELAANDYDPMKLYRLILNSGVYQMTSSPALVEGAEKEFARYPLRRLDAEVLIDAINKVTGTSDLYTSAIPEPFTYIPQGQPAVSIADGSITSPFLTLFGRSARATGIESERSNKMMPGQALHLLNSSHIQRKIEKGPWLKTIMDSSDDQSEIAMNLYLTVLSRFPTRQELDVVLAFGKPGKKGGVSRGRDEWTDIAWALINSSEFLHRH